MYLDHLIPLHIFAPLLSLTWITQHQEIVTLQVLLDFPQVGLQWAVMECICARHMVCIWWFRDFPKNMHCYSIALTHARQEATRVIFPAAMWACKTWEKHLFSPDPQCNFIPGPWLVEQKQEMPKRKLNRSEVLFVIGWWQSKDVVVGKAFMLVAIRSHDHNHFSCSLPTHQHPHSAPPRQDARARTAIAWVRARKVPRLSSVYTHKGLEMCMYILAYDLNKQVGVFQQLMNLVSFNEQTHVYIYI